MASVTCDEQNNLVECPIISPSLSNRACKTVTYSTFSSQYTKQIQANLYHKYDNPQGIINMGQAVNRLMEEDILSRLNKSDALTLTSRHQYYYDTSGITQFRQAIADFLSRHHKPSVPINPDNLVVLSGVTGCLDALAHTICDPEDIVITPTPVYGRIFTDFMDRAGTSVVPLVTTEENDFSFQPEDLEDLVHQQMNEGRRPRVCVILNPHNPLGDIYSTSQLTAIMEVCARHKIHIIIDEIYAFSVHDEDTNFVSALALESLPDPQRTHVVWGFSKDFSIPGFRLGVIHSFNKEVVSCLRVLSAYYSNPQLIQHAAATVISDKEWCDEFYIPTNQKRLAFAHQTLCEGLQAVGIKVHKAVAGLFVWANLQTFLQPCTEQQEMALFKALVDGGVCILPGNKLLCSSPGWFRIVFALPSEELEIGIKRIETVLLDWKDNST